MCFKHSSKPMQMPVQDSVERHQADASITKNSATLASQNSIRQNIKTTPLGLQDTTDEKKTLLGE